ncbi:cation diffusion facilitator family transporter [Shewanella gelidimarina]|uniref:cation diffusion facilitator family transporter n=1 Tax=Shewanella gelidimarina TaxID=56813 RepID=UPI00200C5774|nr:cation diffusion facilitator family transporter [Shewanella gelidimarina]MCL1056712.1 cation diffusion facilitator family transporter [Shewanella gelidimarina]
MAHAHPHDFEKNSKKLYVAIIINIILTAFQVVGGIMAGSLSLLADALHNFSDAGAIIIAVIARKIGNKPANNKMSFGYKRAEIIGTLINSVSLIAVGLYLIVESFERYFNPQPVDGWIVFVVAGIALIIDIATALLTYSSGAKDNLNIRAAFIHNVSDAMASVAVIIAGVLIIYFQWYVVDLITTAIISVYVIYHGIILLRKSILILMEAAPEDIDIEEVKQAITRLDCITRVEHVHIWEIADKRYMFTADIVVNEVGEKVQQALASDAIKQVKTLLKSKFEIEHSTIERHFP